jgi:uncharacterized protein
MARSGFATQASSRSADRSTFITKTYAHLVLAVLTFMGIESFLLNSEAARGLASSLFSNWIVIFMGFMLISWVATRFAHSKSKAVQYGGLGLYVVMWSIMFLPLMMLAQQMAHGENDLIFKASMITLSGFFALTAIAFVTRKNFSFLRGFIMWGGFIAIGLIACSFIFGLSLGVWFSAAMVGLAGAAILYDTSNVIHEYDEDQYVGAALQLFASLALMLWYVLQLVMSFSGDD